MDEKLTSSLEDYVEAIYNIIQKNGKVRAIDVSRELKVSRASTTEALKKLAEKKYINYGRYDAISMTELGIQAALNVTKKHDALKNFLENILGVDNEQAHKNACRIEHVISDEIFERLCAFSNYYIENYKDDFIKKYNQ